jgi:hypothetical protein
MSAHSSRPRALLILGMHRSGTSAVTRAVNLLGADIGKNILLPGKGNSEGFWEHHEAMEINHHLLEAFGRTWFDIRPLPQDWTQQAPGRLAFARIQALIRIEFAPQPLVAVKDPRMCLTAPLWIEAFEACGYEVQCLLVVRDPREVADSLQAREKWPRDPIFLLWAHYMMESVLATRACRRSLITYDQLLDDWRGTLRRVSSELSLPWPVDENAAAAEMDAFLHTGHRHHVTSDTSSLNDMPSFVADFYTHCMAVAQGNSNWHELDRSALTMSVISELYTPHLDNLLAKHETTENQLKGKVQAYENLLKTLISNFQPKP